MSDEQIKKRLEDTKNWLLANCFEVFEEQKHLDVLSDGASSLARKYWHYGYYIGLRDAVEKLYDPIKE